jgi:hypothetical protein
MAYFMHLDVWPPKSSLTTPIPRNCVTSLWNAGEGLEHKVRQMVNTQKFQILKSQIVC